MASVNPSPDRLEKFLGSLEVGAPLVMINLLKYRDQADYPAGFDAAPCTGREAYQRYAAVALGKVTQVGGKPLWMGSVTGSLIAPDGEEWDEALLVQYPSRQAFLQMVAMPDYQAVAVHRTAALADSRLIATVTRGGPLAE